jgi:hypothetical protein
MPGKTVETAFGAVDEKALETLQHSFDSRRLLNAVDAVDQVRSRINGLREDLLDLHRMAAEVINEDYGHGPAREEPIWELADLLASEMLEFADGLRQACGAVEELESLAPADDWDGEEDAGE